MAALQRARDGLRFLVVTLALTFAYLGLQSVWESLTDLTVRAGFLPGSGEVTYADEAKRLATQSAGVEARLPATHRADAWRLGYLLGYGTEWIGSFALSAPERRQKARESGGPMLAQAKGIASRLGVEPVDVLSVRTLADFTNLTARLESDESGIAGRVANRVSPRAAHLVLLGMHTGVLMAQLESGSDENSLPIPQTTLIAKHATLAGIDPVLWRTLQRLPNGGTRKQTIEGYRAAVMTLDRALDDEQADIAPAARIDGVR